MDQPGRPGSSCGGEHMQMTHDVVGCTRILRIVHIQFEGAQCSGAEGGAERTRGWFELRLGRGEASCTISYRTCEPMLRPHWMTGAGSYQQVPRELSVASQGLICEPVPVWGSCPCPGLDLIPRRDISEMWVQASGRSAGGRRQDAADAAHHGTMSSPGALMISEDDTAVAIPPLFDVGLVVIPGDAGRGWREREAGDVQGPSSH